LRIARLYLEDDDPVQAEVFINRASLLQNETRDEKLQILYRVGDSVFFIKEIIFFFRHVMLVFLIINENLLKLPNVIMNYPLNQLLVVKNV
jgi:hypothetical protein